MSTHDASFEAGAHAEGFADEIRLFGGLEPGPQTDRVLEAFKAVPREAFAGPGPWLVRSPLHRMAPHRTPDDDPRWLYHCVLIVLDERQGINIGEPSLWARFLSQAHVRPGSRILQVGAGAGYYTAVLRHLAGPEGSVLAYELDAHLAGRARETLRGHNGVDVRHGNATSDLASDDVFDLIVVFAGATHVPRLWSDRLAPDGRVLLPLTGVNGWGVMALASPVEGGFDVQTLGRCGFYPCIGARDAVLARHIDRLWADDANLGGSHMRITGTDSDIDYEVDGQAI